MACIKTLLCDLEDYSQKSVQKLLSVLHSSNAATDSEACARKVYKKISNVLYRSAAEDSKADGQKSFHFTFQRLLYM